MQYKLDKLCFTSEHHFSADNPPALRPNLITPVHSVFGSLLNHRVNEKRDMNVQRSGSCGENNKHDQRISWIARFQNSFSIYIFQRFYDGMRSGKTLDENLGGELDGLTSQEVIENMTPRNRSIANSERHITCHLYCGGQIAQRKVFATTYNESCITELQLENSQQVDKRCSNIQVCHTFAFHDQTQFKSFNFDAEKKLRRQTRKSLPSTNGKIFLHNC